jgi:hypothetical protein
MWVAEIADGRGGFSGDFHGFLLANRVRIALSVAKVKKKGQRPFSWSSDCAEKSHQRAIELSPIAPAQQRALLP